MGFSSREIFRRVPGLGAIGSVCLLTVVAWRPAVVAAQPPCVPVVDHIEWTQATQTGRTETVLLVNRRSTTVRVYAVPSGGCTQIPNVTANAVVKSLGFVPPDLHMRSESGPITVSSATGWGSTARLDETKTFNFTFVPTWVTDELSFTVCLAVQATQSTSCESGTSSLRTVVNVEAPRVLGVLFAFNGDVPPGNWSGLTAGSGDKGMRAVMPFPESPEHYWLREPDPDGDGLADDFFTWPEENTGIRSCFSNGWSALSQVARDEGADIVYGWSRVENQLVPSPGNTTLASLPTTLRAI